MAKKAKRRIKRINGQLTVVYVDAETGAVLNNLDGYEFHTQDGFSNTDTVAPVEKVEEPVVATPTRTNDRSSNADFWTKSDWATDEKRSKGTGDILGDFRSAAGVLGERIDGVKGTLMNGILTTAGRVIGRDLVADKDNINNAVDGAVDAAGNAVTGAIENITGQAPGWLGDTIGGFFGGGDKPAATTTVTPTAPGIQWNGREDHLTDPLMQTVAAASENLTFGLNVVSGYRTREQNEAAGGADESQHIHGNAMDISIKDMTDAQKSALVTSLAENGAKRIGVYSGNTGLHVDMAEGYPPPEGFSFYPMFDGTRWGKGGAATGTLLAGAPSWFVETAKGNPLPEAQQFMKSPDAPVTPTTPDANAAAMGTTANTKVNPKLLSAVGELKTKQGKQVLVDGQPISPDMLTQNQNGLEYDRNGNLVGYDNLGFEKPGYTPPEKPSPKLNNYGFNQDVNKMAGPGIPTPAPEPFKARHPKPIVEAPTNALGAVNAMGTGLDPVKKAYLDTINYAEGNPAMNQAFGVNQYFEPTKGHPSTFNSEFNTSAAGKYQWTEPTWNEYSVKAGVDDFSNEEHQDRAAWQLASDNYKARTGGDLYNALLSNDPSAFTANSNRWSSLPGGKHPRTEIPELMGKFTEAMGKYNTPPVREPLAPAPKIETPTGFMSKPKVSAPITQPTVPSSPKLDKPVANTPISGKTNNTLRDPTISESKTGGFMPKTGSAKTSSSDPRPTPSTSKPASSSPKINSSPIAGRPATPSGQKQSAATPVSPKTSTKLDQTTTGSTSSNKTSNTGTTKTKTSSPSSKSYNPTGR